MWQPAYQFLSVRQFRDNIKLAVETHTEETLAALEAEGAMPPELDLPPFQGINFDRAVREAYPVLNILTLGGDPELNASGNYEEDKGILLEVEQIADDKDDLIETLEPYVLVVRSIVASMTEAEISRGIDTESRSDFLIAVGSERYGERRYESENTYVRVGSVIAKISYLEVERSY